MRKTIFTLGLMLAAALSLTNCTKNEEATFTPEVKVPFELYANMDDTRTTNNGLSTKWAANDEINVFHAVAGKGATEGYVNDGKFTTDNGDGKFKGSLASTLTADAYDWYALYPYTSQITSPAEQTEDYVYIGSEYDKAQTQTGNNSMAHIAGENYPLVGVKKNVLASDKPAITMSHISSLVEFEVTNKLTEDITVTSIALTALEDIVGTYYIDFTGEKIDYTPGDQVSQTATLNVSNGAAIANGQSAKFYMAIKPTEFDGDNILITINASTANGKGVIMEIEKEVETTFYPGKVKTLKVNFNAEIEEPKYNMISTIDKLTAGQYYMAAYLTSYDGNDWAATPYHLWNGIVNSGDLVTVDYSFNDNVLETSSSDSAAVVTLEAVAGKANTYYVKCGGKYLYSTQSATNRKLALSTDPAEWVATDNANGGITLSSNSVYLGTASASSRLLRSYNAENKLKAGVYFFAATDGEVTPDPTPDPEPTPEVKAVTVAEFLDATENSTVYELTGVISNVTNTTYGNFDLTDETGTVLIYGLCSPTGETKYWTASGAKAGDTITVQTVRTSYNGTPQGKNAIFVKLVAGSTTPEPEPDPTPGGAKTIAEILAAGQGATLSGTIEGVVISNMDLNNLTSKKGMYVQDATGAIQLRLSADHTIAFGTKVSIDLTGTTLGQYSGAVQISVANDKITTVSTGNTVEPKTVTIAVFLANKYEGQYVAIEGVQVADSDLAKTWVSGGAHTSINVEDAAGNKFVVFSSKYATYGTQTVAQGSGTIKGISSINNGTIQIIFAQESDIAGLTGERFGATTPEPEPEPEPDGETATATIDFTAQSYGNGQVIESFVANGVTVTLNKGTNSDAPKYYTSGSAVRVYGGNYFTVSSTSTITKIELTFGSSDGSNEITTDCEAYSNGVWTGSANSVKFTIGGTKGNRRIKKIVVYTSAN